MTEHELNRMTRLAAPLGAVAVAMAVAFGAFAAMAQSPTGAPSLPVPGNKAPNAQDSPGAQSPTAAPAPSAPGASARPNGRATESADKAPDMIGMSVIDRSGQVIGSVTKIDRTPSGEIRNIEISTGGFLGLGSKILRVPGDKVERSGQQLVLNLAPDQIKTMTQ